MDIDEEIRKEQEARRKGISLTEISSEYDNEIYTTNSKTDRSVYVAELMEEEEEDDHNNPNSSSHHSSSFTSGSSYRLSSNLPQRIIQDQLQQSSNDSSSNSNDITNTYREQFGSGLANSRITDRENEYKRKGREKRTLSPERGGADVYAGDVPNRSYAEILKEHQLLREKDELLKKLQKQEQEKELIYRSAVHTIQQHHQQSSSSSSSSSLHLHHDKHSHTLQDEGDNVSVIDSASTIGGMSVSGGYTSEDNQPHSNVRSSSNVSVISSASVTQWDETPLVSKFNEDDGGATPLVSSSQAWETPMIQAGANFVPSTSAAGRKRSRWDETPVGVGSNAFSSTAATPLVNTSSLLTGSISTSSSAATTSTTTINPTQARIDAEIDYRNRPLTDDELDAMLPTKGYKIIEPPTAYVPIRTPSRKALTTPTPQTNSGFFMAATPAREDFGIPMTPNERNELGGGNLPTIKPEDMQYFGTLLDESVDESTLSPEDLKERKIAKLLLKIKNGTPPQRKIALKQISEKAREFGAGPLFNQLLPLFMSSTLEDQERHLLVKVIDRILFRLDDLVRPYVHKILVVIQPMLIDEDYYARVEGREIISNVAKAAGLATMIAVMRPDIDNPDDYVRNTTARAFAVVASALGIPAILPFLKAVIASKKSWQARHTGLKIIQHMAILMGCAILPHLRQLVEFTGPALTDEQQKVKIVAALALASLAESAYPYGIESFDTVLRPLWKGVKQHRGKALSAFLKAIGVIIPLMNPDYAGYYTKEIMPTLIREFSTPDEEMKKIVLKVVQQTCSCEGVTAEYIRTDVLPEFFRNFWVRRMALDRRNYRAVVDTTVELANRVGVNDTIKRIVNDLKDESAPYVRMVVEAIDKIIGKLGASNIDTRLEELLMDGIIFAFQEQNGEVPSEAKIILQGFGTIVSALGLRTKPYIPQIAGTIKWRLNNKSPTIRALAADLVQRIAYIMKACSEDNYLAHLGVVLYECLGEEYPDTLGSILGGLKGIVSVIGMGNMEPPIKDLLPRLTPILKNHHEKVQENCIDVVGRIADRGASYVSSREWMRIVFELLEMLRAPLKSIRRAAVNTFGYIAKAIGPHDVMYTLLNNLKVQERQNRVCTTVAIAIIAETCAPFTVLPSLMNEYRIPELNVQNGVLKALSFLFEYIGEMAADYVYAVTPLLEDALTDRDMVHRQIACNVVKHLALGLQGRGYEDVLLHLLNFIWSNIFETSPHVIQAVFDAIEALRVSIGPSRIFAYTLQGLFHPARRVREVYWRLYNNLYVYSVDALTPLYPRITNDEPLMVALPDEMINNSKKNKKNNNANNENTSNSTLLTMLMEEEEKDTKGEEEDTMIVRARDQYRQTYLELFI